jgi:D-alanine-D-alanine ligase
MELQTMTRMSKNGLRSKRIGVLLGGLSAEREVSLQSGSAILRALQARGYQAVPIDVDELVCRQLIAANVEVAFLGLHGRWGEDGCMQGMLEAMRIPYTGSGVLASALAMDNVVSKRLFAIAGLPTASWGYPATPETVLELGLPAVIKPRREGSSVGLSVVRAADQIVPAIERAGGSAAALVERYIAGRELSVAVLGEQEAARVLGSVEIRPAEGLYDYEAKYNRDDTQYVVPAPVPEATARRIAELALAVHRLLECSGATRTDFLWDGQDDPVVLEINTLPGMTSHSLLPKIAAHAGMSYDDLVEAMAQDAGLKNV